MLQLSSNPSSANFWNRRVTLVACILGALIPLVWPPIPPLVDLPGHMGRYAVELDPGPFRQWYEFHWRIIGNLGVDLLIVPMAKVFGLELATKLIIMAIPALTVAGMLWIAREVHGCVPPTAFFALPLAYGHPFVFGFVNFSLSMAFALLAFALWLYLARREATTWRAIVFLPLSCVVWLAHVFGWGLLGLLCASAELVRQRDTGRSWLTAATATGVACLPLAVPLVPMLAWRAASAPGNTGDWFDWQAKQQWLAMTLRTQWQGFDLISIWLLVGVILLGLGHRALGFSRPLTFALIVLVATYIALPRIVFGSAYADMRLTPYLFAIAILAIRPTAAAQPRFLTLLASLGLVFFGVRIAGTTVAFAATSGRYQQALVALDHLPVGTRVAAFVGQPCGMRWATNRMEHLPALAIVRRRAFVNDQWSVSGSSPMTIVKSDAGDFAIDPSQMVTSTRCLGSFRRSLDAALATFPRAAFDYVWLLDAPRFDARLTVGMDLVWSSGTDRLYRIAR